MLRALIALMAMAGPALGQTVPVFTGRTGAPAQVNDPIKLSEVSAAFGSKQDTLSPSTAAQSAVHVGDFAINSIVALSDTIHQTSATVYGVSMLYVLDVLPGGHTSARNLITSEVRLNGPSAAGSANHNYVGGYFRGVANSGDGGVSGAEQGAVFGLNAVSSCNAGATYLLDCTGLEVDAGMYTGASSVYRTGLRLSSFGNAKASLLDAALHVAVLGNPAAETGWRTGIAFTGLGGSGNPVTGTLIAGVTDGTTPGGLVAVNGIDLSAYTFSNAAMLLPGGFVVRPNGRLEVPALIVALHTPASSTEACVAGQASDDASYHYVCVATNTWKRVALSAF